MVSAKVGGLLAERWRQPSVLGELLAGIALGNLLPLFVGVERIAFIPAEPTLLVLAEVGVLILLFDVGLEADLRALIRVGPSSGLVALIGIVIPIGLGWSAALWLLPESPMVVHLFVGATLSATSVGITARVLKDLGRMQSPEGQIILGAAILDDVLGLIVLAVVTGIAAATAGGAALSSTAIAGILLRAFLFLGLTVGLGHFLSSPIVRLAARTGHPEIMLVVGLGLCFTLAFVAELIGLATIIGAFAAGLLLDPYGSGVRTREEDATLAELLHPLSSLFVPLFFVLMGTQVDLGSLGNLINAGVWRGIDSVRIRWQVGLCLRRAGRRNQPSGRSDWDDSSRRGRLDLRRDWHHALTRRPALAFTGPVLSGRVDGVLVTTLVTPVGLRWILSIARHLNRVHRGS